MLVGSYTRAMRDTSGAQTRQHLGTALVSPTFAPLDAWFYFLSNFLGPFLKVSEEITVTGVLYLGLSHPINPLIERQYFRISIPSSFIWTWLYSVKHSTTDVHFRAWPHCQYKTPWAYEISRHRLTRSAWCHRGQPLPRPYLQ